MVIQLKTESSSPYEHIVFDRGLLCLIRSVLIEIDCGCDFPDLFFAVLKIRNDILNENKHQDNMSVCLIPPYTPLLYSKTGVYRGIHFFLFLL